MAELTSLSIECAPRRFTYCVVSPDGDDGAVVCWGMAFDGEVIAYLPSEDDADGRSSLMRATSAQRVRRLFHRAADIRLIWIDS